MQLVYVGTSICSSSQESPFCSFQGAANRKELLDFYSMYDNLPFEKVKMRLDGSHATVSLCQIVASFLTLGVDDLVFNLSILKEPTTSYFASLEAKAVN
jgi:hypothetical protein